MSSEHKSIWYRLGYALQRTRPRPPGARLAGLAERRTEPDRPRAAPRSADRFLRRDDLLASAAVALAGRVLDTWRPRGRPGPGALLRAGLSGAAAALIVDLIRPLLERGARPSEPDRGVADRILAGVGQGLLYGGLVEPRVPGSPLVKGALYGTAEYAADPAGGLRHVLGPHAPDRRIPLLGRLFEDMDEHDRAYVEHLAFGIVLAVTYGSSRSNNGILSEKGER